MSRWDNYFLQMAEVCSWMSKDPSTKVGAVIVKDRRIIATGFNGFPPRIADDSRLSIRENKYQIIVHAEMNAMLNCPVSTYGSTLYTYPLPPCFNCAKAIIAAGIDRIVFPNYEIPDRWFEDMRQVAYPLFHEAKVTVDEQEYVSIAPKAPA